MSVLKLSGVADELAVGALAGGFEFRLRDDDLEFDRGGIEAGYGGLGGGCDGHGARGAFLKMERKTRFELATLALARRCSTTELLPRRGDPFQFFTGATNHLRFAGAVLPAVRSGRAETRTLMGCPTGT